MGNSIHQESGDNSKVGWGGGGGGGWRGNVGNSIHQESRYNTKRANYSHQDIGDSIKGVNVVTPFIRRVEITAR